MTADEPEPRRRDSRPPRRVMIFGGPGAGKTWLAAEIGRRLGLPIIAVDDALHDERGRLRPAAEIDARLREAVRQPSWIIEGGGTRTYRERAERAELALRLVPPVWLRLVRVLRRSGLRPTLLLWTLRYDCVFGPMDEAALRAAGPRAETCELRRRQEIEALLARLDRAAAAETGHQAASGGMGPT